MKIQDYAKMNNVTADENDFAFEVANLITEARLKAGLTQKELAELIGTQQPSIARIENGTKLPTLSFLKKIAKAIGTELLPPRFAFMQPTIKSQASSDSTMLIFVEVESKHDRRTEVNNINYDHAR